VLHAGRTTATRSPAGMAQAVAALIAEDESWTRAGADADTFPVFGSMMRAIGRTMMDGRRTCGGCCWPVAHSLSPLMHIAAFEALGLAWCYVPLPDQPRPWPRRCVAGALGFRGAT
jgi:hypothetical protein